MNFLSHYYFHQQSRNPELILGAVLPDLLKNFDKSIRIQPQQFELAFLNNPLLSSVYEGWIHHMQIDRDFHNLPFFYEHTHELKLLVKPALENTPIRPSFLSHIALELLLDHLLLKDGLSDYKRFYASLDAVNTPNLIHFMAICEVKDSDGFLQFFERFKEHAYIGSYLQLDQISVALLQICRRLWTFEIPTDQIEVLTACLENYMEQLAPVYMQVFDRLS